MTSSGWSGGAKVLCILHHRGVQLILAYSWARPAILVVGKVRGGMFLFCFFTFIPVPLSSLSLSFISSTLSSISFLPFSGRRHKMTLKGWRVVKPQHNQQSMTSSCGLLPVTCNGCDPRGKPNSHTPGLAAPSLTLYDQFPGHSFQVFRFCSSNWKLCWTLVPVPLSPDLTTVLLQWRFIIPRFLNPTFSGYQFYTPQLHHLCASIIASHDPMHLFPSVAHKNQTFYKSSTNKDSPGIPAHSTRMFFYTASELCLNAIQPPLPSYIRFHVSCLMMEDLGILVLRVFLCFLWSSSSDTLLVSEVTDW